MSKKFASVVSEVMKKTVKDEKEFKAMESEMSDSNEMKSMLKEWKKITEQKKKLLKGMEKEIKKMK
ncbi:MAG: hypothetical protein ABJ263_15895 [Tateyamaria sp.]|uniref:hypothetical protein n=2 Tax=Tateyamaria sp. TaxID=1929288 RepID=UPI00327C77F2